MADFVQLEVDVINGEVQEFPVLMNFRTDILIPVGQTIIRYFNEAMCSVAKRTFLMSYGLESFGTCQLQTSADFWQLVYESNASYLNMDGCNVLMDGMCVTL